MRLRQCHNLHDVRKLAKRRLPAPIFNDIDGGAEGEATVRRNTASFEAVARAARLMRWPRWWTLRATGWM